MLPRRVLIRCDLIISTLPIRVGIPLIPLTGSWQSFERDHQCVRSNCQLRRKGSDTYIMLTPLRELCPDILQWLDFVFLHFSTSSERKDRKHR